MNDRLRDSWLPPVMFAMSIVYLLGTIYALLVWTGLEPVDPALWPEAALPFYALVFLAGGVSALAIGAWKRWGVYGLIVTWIATTALNAVFAGSLALEPTTIMALLLVVLFAYELPRVWRHLS